jgi:hypothetical protein
LGARRRSNGQVGSENNADILERSRKDLELKTFIFGNVVSSIEKDVEVKEHQRDGKMKCKLFLNKWSLIKRKKVY